MQPIGLVTFPGFNVMSLTAVSVFEVANVELGERRYDFQFLSESGGSMRTSAGLTVETRPFDDFPLDTIIVGGGAEESFRPSEGMIAFLRKAPQISRRLAATCVGAFTLAEAGLLDGRRVTTHWDYARELQRRYPKVKVQEDRIFVIDGPVWTSAGMTATLDLALAMVEWWSIIGVPADNHSSRPFSNLSRSLTESKLLSHLPGKISTTSLRLRSLPRQRI